MLRIVGCLPIARRLSLSFIGGAACWVLLVLWVASTTVVSSGDASNQMNYVLISLLTASTFAGSCAVHTNVAEFGSPMRAGLVYGLRAALVVVLISTPLCYAYAVVSQHNMSVVLAFTGVSSVLVPLSMVFAGIVQRPLLALRLFRRRVAIIGDSKFLDRVRELSEQVRASVEVAGFFNLGGTHANEAAGRQVCDRSARLEEFVRRTEPDEVIVASLERRADDAGACGLPVWKLLEMKARGMRVVEFSEFWEQETGQVDLDSLRPSWLLFGRDFRVNPTVRAIKRTFDILASCLLFSLTLPIFIVIPVLTKIANPGPVLFRQERVGLHGRSFTLLKFRTMYVDAEVNSGPTWASNRDPRITPLGSFLRSCRLDELPQLWNILKGDMSIVGPRPERGHFVEMLGRSLPFYGLRHCVKPGLTGWAQINQGYAASVQESAEKLSYDLFYLRRCGIFLDFLIILQTVGVVLWKRGSR